MHAWNGPARHLRGAGWWLYVGTQAAFAQAAGDVAPLDPVLVTAAKTPQRQSDALLATTVVTREQIDDSGAPDLATLLRGQPGVDIAQSGGVGSQTSIFLRGANSNQVLVLIDGLRVNATGSGAAPLAHLTIDQIDRIEIVRGNVSALYGSEAIGGVIQIFTRGGTGGADGYGGELTYGSERTRSAALDGRRSFGPEGARTDVGLAVSYRTAKGFSAIDADRVATANPDYDGYRNASLSAHLAQHVGAVEVGVRYDESHGHLEFDDASDYASLDPTYDGRVQTQTERSRQENGQVYATVAPLAGWTTTLSAGQARSLSVSDASFPASFVIGTTTSVDRQYRFDNALSSGAHRGDVFVEHRDEEGGSTAYGGGDAVETHRRHVDSAGVSYAGPLWFPSDRHEFQFAGRYDDYSDFGRATTGLAAYGFRFASGWKAIGQVSSAFKAPSFDDLYYPYYGNPALKPERAHSVELGLQYAVADTYARASLFRTRTRDLVVYDPTVFVANNIDRATVKGVELSARTVAFGWLLSFDATFAHPVDDETGQRLLRRANRNARVAVSRTFGRWRFGGDVEAASRRSDTDLVTFGPTAEGGYAVANFNVRYAVSSKVTVGASVSNAFDKRYALVDGYRTADRVALATVSVRE